MVLITSENGRGGNKKRKMGERWCRGEDGGMRGGRQRQEDAQRVNQTFETEYVVANKTKEVKTEKSKLK